MIEKPTRRGTQKERTVLIGLFGAETPRWLAQEYLDELELLADTAGAETVEKILQNRPQPDPNTYVGKGKLRGMKQLTEDLNADLLIFDDDLTATQIRNVEKTVKIKVLDRSGLILDIFASRAKTAAAKTQVELAQLQYLLPRLTRFWTHLSRQKGGIGTKGPGETQIETDRRLIGNRISILKQKLEKLDRQRTTQRKHRTEITRVALVGYTNAGKSTLMNALTDTDVLAEDRLFATLDSTVRRLELAHHTVLLSDTVGFIRKLPHNLIESFKSTLDEVRDADLLLQVIDGSSRLFEDVIEVVQRTLREIGAGDQKRLLVFNKIDKLPPEQLIELKKEYPEALFVSASRAIGLSDLRRKIETIIEEDYIPFHYQIPVSHYKAVAFLHDVAVITEETYTEDRVDIRGRFTRANQKRFQSLMEGMENVLCMQEN